MEEKEKTAPSVDTNQIEWRIPENVLRPYATNLLVQAGEHEIILSFFDIQHSVIIGYSDEAIAQSRKHESIPANYVAGVIVAIDKMPSFIKVMQDVYDFSKKKQAEK